MLNQSRLVGYVALFTSFGTLVCCALPSLLVLIGLGATVASFLTAVPWLVTLSQHKASVFTVSGLLIGANIVYVYHLVPKVRTVVGRRTTVVSQDPEDTCATPESDSCARADRRSRAVLSASVALYAAGFFAAFVLGPLLERFG
jgi:hypothetical protein